MRMSKVVLTKEQAEAIEKIKKDVKGGITYGNIEAQLHKRWTLPTFKSLNTLNIKEFLDALYIGYEVEPEFKVGDWVVTESGYIGEIEFINKVEGWANVGYSKDTKIRGVCLAKTFNLTAIERHATDEEIATEKERRWWEKNGREVWELKEGDILISKKTDKVYEVGRVSDNVIKLNVSYYHINDVKQDFKVACFAEQRLDKEDTQ